MLKEKCICLICQITISTTKKCNLERHFRTTHSKFDIDFRPKTEVRKKQLEKLKLETDKQQLIFTKPVLKSKAATIASLRISHVLAKNKKSFRTGEIVKQAFLEGTDALFENFKNKSEILSAINDLQLYRKTVTRRVESIGQNLVEILKQDIKEYVYFSLQFDESTDITDTTQLFCITTDGAPAMIGKNNGFIALCKNDNNFPNVITFHCVIHQQALCGKILNTSSIMDIAFKIANSIRSRSLQRRLFKLQLEENDFQHCDLLLHTDVRWLSSDTFLERFQCLFPEIIEFSKSRGDNYDCLTNNTWLQNLAFLTDITAHLNTLNVELQGKDGTIIELLSSINGFKSKLILLKSQLNESNLNNFPNLKDFFEKQKCTVAVEIYCSEVEKVYNEFERRFKDIQKLEPIITFMFFPFSETNNIFLKARGSETNFWNLLSEEKYPGFRNVALQLHSYFGSTYLCETEFSHMKMIKTEFRSTLSDDHLEQCLRLAVSNYSPDYDQSANDMQCHTSTMARSTK
ncbi:general transcription factor II-I repeat domain-containing protein 2A-like [Rhopalosiphum maidis]|uniref:general transcription factor II-I repeat domain-containing protein 2A-like n=1 Tax=Rhopalosiphum maidis TaxID=43146 RepID=UPI000EFFFCB8|nr:general transcription factor II-I repeat domain-containing protein 2A-like [Rhopalosiphum maidis]